MSARLLSLVTIFAVGAGAASAAEKRQLDAHEHGHGKLNIAVEGATIHMELEVPGSDIVGFEHAAASDEDKAKIAAAKKVLAGATSLFSLSAAAGCTLSAATAELDGEGSAHDHKEDGHKEHGASDNEQGDHSEFRVEYTFRCKTIDALGTIRFPYFKAFPNAEELDVTLITEKGQKSFEVSRERDRIDFQGLM